MATAPFAHRRFARECALQALYLAEFAKMPIVQAIDDALQAFESPDVFAEIVHGSEDAEVETPPEGAQELFRAFTTKLAEGTWRKRTELDALISAALSDYDFDRLAAVDRNLLRLATFEIVELPYVPPAVTVNEAVEIAKKYSTADSGRFVNGVLGGVIKRTAKAHWDPAKAPVDPDMETIEEVFRAPARPIVEEVVEEGSDKAKMASRYGSWQLKTED